MMMAGLGKRGESPFMVRRALPVTRDYRAQGHDKTVADFRGKRNQMLPFRVTKG